MIATETNGASNFNLLLNTVLQLADAKWGTHFFYDDVNRLLKIENALPLLKLIYDNIDILVYLFNFTGSQLYNIAKHPRALITFDYLIYVHKYLIEFGFTSQDIVAIASYNCGKENIEAAMDAVEKLRQYGFENWHIVRIIANGHEDGHLKIHVLLYEVEYFIYQRGLSIWEVLLLCGDDLSILQRLLRYPSSVSVSAILQELWQRREHLTIPSSLGSSQQSETTAQTSIIQQGHDEQVIVNSSILHLTSPTFRLSVLRRSIETDDESMFPGNRSGGVLCRTAIIESLRSNDRSSTQYPT